MRKTTSGFTIVELLIVIVVIGILAAITIVAYNGVQQRAIESTLKSDLANASKQIELSNADDGSYPTSFPSDVKVSKNVTLSLSQNGTGYCINAESLTNSTMQWSFSSPGGGLQTGLCSGMVIAGSELGANPNLVTNTSFSSGWGLNFQTVAGRTLTTRAGTTGDPYPTRPVLILTNSATTTTTWAVIVSSSVNYAGVTLGNSYTASYYARKTGPYSSTTASFGLLDGNGLNVTLSQSLNGATTSTSWQKITATSSALRTGTNGNVVYLAIPTSQFTTSGWTLEFQGFDLRQQ